MHNIKVEGRKISKAHWLFIWNLLADECEDVTLDIAELSIGGRFHFTRTSFCGRVDLDVEYIGDCLVFKCW